MTGAAAVRILLADDHPLLRAGIRTALQVEPSFRVVGEAGDGQEVLDLLERNHAELLILDLKMRGRDPCDLIRRCRELAPALKVLVLSGYSDSAYLFALREVGIQGFVVKEEAPVSLLQAVRVVASGGSWFSQLILQKLRNRSDIPPVVLTDREVQVLRALSLGKNNQSIACLLEISKETVRRYITSLYAKLGVKTRVQAALWLKNHRERGLEGVPAGLLAGDPSP